MLNITWYTLKVMCYNLNMLIFIGELYPNQAGGKDKRLLFPKSEHSTDMETRGRVVGFQFAVYYSFDLFYKK